MDTEELLVYEASQWDVIEHLHSNVVSLLVVFV